MKITHKFIVRKSAISIPTPAEISEEIRSRAMLAAQRVLWQSDGVISVIVFLFGLAIGSFLNVCICRLPHGESIVTPPSHCPQCGRHIRIWDNIPVLSYVLLRGRCRNCHARISPLYPAVELLTAMLFVGCYRTFGLTPAFAKWTVFCAILLVLIFTDLRDRILPDSVNFTGFAIGLGASLFVPLRENTSLWISNRLFDFPPPNPVLSLMNALIGAACGGGLLWIFGEGYFLLRHREGMGLGDAKMMVVAGAFLGWQNALLTILAASVMGSVIGIAFLAAGRKGRDYEWPFGTFLGISAILVAFWGQPVITWYLSLF